jgi:hypothetical protein
MGMALFRSAHAIVITYQLPPTHKIEARPNYHNVSYMCVCVCVCVCLCVCVSVCVCRCVCV